ncbi:hypothetical protein D3C73_1438460 [compost metagenome]
MVGWQMTVSFDSCGQQTETALPFGSVVYLMYGGKHGSVLTSAWPASNDSRSPRVQIHPNPAIVTPAPNLLLTVEFAPPHAVAAR